MTHTQLAEYIKSTFEMIRSLGINLRELFPVEYEEAVTELARCEQHGGSGGCCALPGALHNLYLKLRDAPPPDDMLDMKIVAGSIEFVLECLQKHQPWRDT